MYLQPKQKHSNYETIVCISDVPIKIFTNNLIADHCMYISADTDN